MRILPQIAVLGVKIMLCQRVQETGVNKWKN